MHQNLTLKPFWPSSLVKQGVYLGLCTRAWVRGNLEKNSSSQAALSSKKVPISSDQ